MRNKYREKLKEKFSAACKTETPDVKPPEEDVNRWIAVAEDRKKKKRRRFELSAGGVFNIVILLFVGVTVLPMIHDAQAGADHKLQMKEPGGNAEATSIEIYNSRENVPKEGLEGFLVFPEKFDDFEEVEIRITEDANHRILKSTYENDREMVTIIYQTDYYSENSSKAIVMPSSKKENWNGVEVWIVTSSTPPTGKEYLFMYDGLLVRINANESIAEERVKDLVAQVT